LRIYNLSGGRVLVCILVCGGIIVHNLSTRYTLAYKINSKISLVYRANLVKWVRYKARDPIKFKEGKERNTAMGVWGAVAAGGAAAGDGQAVTWGGGPAATAARARRAT